MAANLEKRGSVFHFRQVINGKLYRKTTGFSDLARAKRRAAELENDIHAGKLGWSKPDVPVFRVCATKFLAAYYPKKYTEAHLLKAVIDRWATRPLNTITSTEIQQFFRDMEHEGYSGATLERTRVLLKKLFRTAIADKVIDTNPLADIQGFDSNIRERVVSADQEARMRALLQPVWDRYLTVALGTGVRAGEQRMFRPMDLRHGGTWIWVRPESNKTGKGREVPLTPDVMAALEQQKASREGDDTVSYWPFGKTAAAHAFERVCARVEPVIKPAFSPHDFRRTFATRCAGRGVYPKVLQTILGHADIQTTMKFYVRLEQASVRNALLEIAK